MATTGNDWQFPMRKKAEKLFMCTVAILHPTCPISFYLRVPWAVLFLDKFPEIHSVTFFINVPHNRDVLEG